MPATYTRVFTVQGSTQFPFDMLRYDRCTPDSETDSYQIIHNVNNSVDGKVYVTMRHTCTNKNWIPTLGRWESFGWRVIELQPAIKDM